MTSGQSHNSILSRLKIPHMDSSTDMASYQDGSSGLPRVLPANSTISRLSLTPATQTTTVTTTTTTTVAYPPLIMRAPKDLRNRDPEAYPLALRPTPPTLKKLRFELEGQVASFEEAEDADVGMVQYEREIAFIKSSNGSTTSARPYHSHSRPSTRSAHPMANQNTGSRQSSFEEFATLRKQSATPISLSDDAGDSGSETVDLESFQRRQRRHAALPKRHTSINDSNSKLKASNENPNPDTHPRKPSSRLQHAPAFRRTTHQAEGLPRPDASVHQFTGSSTPPSHQDSDEETTFIATQPDTGARRPSSIDSTPVEEVSLPSPSLSPITAAAQMHRALPASKLRQTEYFDASSPYLSGVGESSVHSDVFRVPAKPEAVGYPKAPAFDFQASPRTVPSIADIPNMLDTFDSMPENLQSYVMYQLLRRSCKKTLVMTSRAVAPALTVDFFKRLPLELSQQIVGFLDRKSLCRAAQVSKRWRQVVDTDEKAWMDLITADGFSLPHSEVERAIREGWAWQYPRHRGWFDRDLSRSRLEDFHEVESHMGPAQSTSDEASVQASPSLKRKRKDTARSITTTNSKKQKRTKARPSTQLASVGWPIDWTSGFRPNAFASLAAYAVPNPSVGIRSLRQLHLFKSIYRRQFLMRRSWLNPKTKPKHIAFKAHEGHVVTCLQFDSEKILTGSDDAIIDIYDTNTGARLKRLSGHEGGVWALEYQDNILVSGSTDRSVRIWNMDTGKCLHVFQGHTSTVRCLQIVQPVQVGSTTSGKAIMMPPHRLIITGSRDSNCRIWRLPRITDRGVFQAGPAVSDLDNPYFVRALTGHSHSVRAIAAHADTLVSGSYDGTVRVWQISTGETLHRLSGHSTKVYSVVLDYQRKRCISGSMDTSVKVWSIESGECLFNLHGHQSLVGLLDLKDNILVSAAADFTLKVWDPETGQIQHTLKAHTGAITCFAHDGHKVISGSERTLKMWDIKTGQYVKDLLTDLRGVWQVRFDERRCIAAVHRDDWTFIEILDFGAAWDRVPEDDRGRRIVVDANGEEVKEAPVSTEADETEVHAEIEEIEEIEEEGDMQDAIGDIVSLNEDANRGTE